MVTAPADVTDLVSDGMNDFGMATPPRPRRRFMFSPCVVRQTLFRLAERFFFMHGAGVREQSLY